MIKTSKIPEPVRRLVLVATVPVWGLVVVFLSLCMSVQSAWIWIMTGEWLASYELPRSWIDGISDPVWSLYQWWINPEAKT